MVAIFGGTFSLQSLSDISLVCAILFQSTHWNGDSQCLLFLAVQIWLFETCQLPRGRCWTLLSGRLVDALSAGCRHSSPWAPHLPSATAPLLLPGLQRFLLIRLALVQNPRDCSPVAALVLNFVTSAVTFMSKHPREHRGSNLFLRLHGSW